MIYYIYNYIYILFNTNMGLFKGNSASSQTSTPDSVSSRRISLKWVAALFLWNTLSALRMCQQVLPHSRKCHCPAGLKWLHSQAGEWRCLLMRGVWIWRSKWMKFQPPRFHMSAIEHRFQYIMRNNRQRLRRDLFLWLLDVQCRVQAKLNRHCEFV